MFNFRSLFGRRETIICPRCMHGNEIDPRNVQKVTCPCGYVIPRPYVADYKAFLPLFIQLFGWTAVGKTTYLDVLRLHLYHMSKVWPAYNERPITQLDMDHKEILLRERKEGKPPGSTPKKERDQNEVYIMQLDQMALWQSRFLVMMDHAGEMFSRMEDFPIKEIPFLLHTPTTFMLVSLPDMVGSGKQLDALINIYISALEESGVVFEKAHRRLIIVFTKADKIVDLPIPLYDYLISDSLWDTITSRGAQAALDGMPLATYIERMGRVSQAIRQWVDEDVPGGATTLRLLDRKKIDARFCVISATGQDLGGTAGEARLVPRRVMDPFFWALEFQSR